MSHIIRTRRKENSSEFYWLAEAGGQWFQGCATLVTDDMAERPHPASSCTRTDANQPEAVKRVLQVADMLEIEGDEFLFRELPFQYPPDLELVQLRPLWR